MKTSVHINQQGYKFFTTPTKMEFKGAAKHYTKAYAQGTTGQKLLLDNPIGEGRITQKGSS